jgi:hypothetical protein
MMTQYIIVRRLWLTCPGRGHEKDKSRTVYSNGEQIFSKLILYDVAFLVGLDVLFLANTSTQDLPELCHHILCSFIHYSLYVNCIMIMKHGEKQNATPSQTHTGVKKGFQASMSKNVPLNIRPEIDAC